MTVLKKYKPILGICLLILTNRECLTAQTNEYYINKICQPVAPAVASYKRKVVTDKMAERQTFYFITDYLLTGEVFMEAVAISLEPLILDGKCTYYYVNGQKKTEGNYSENMPSGIWKYWSEDNQNATFSEFDIFGKQTFHTNTIKSSENAASYDTETEAEFPGGNKEMNKFLSKNLVYPREAFARSIMGNVIVSLEINKDGKAKNIRPLTKLGFGLEEEAIRVVSLMPTWFIPLNSYANNTIQKTIPVTFRIP